MRKPEQGNDAATSTISRTRNPDVQQGTGLERIDGRFRALPAGGSSGSPRNRDTRHSAVLQPGLTSRSVGVERWRSELSPIWLRHYVVAACHTIEKFVSQLEGSLFPRLESQLMKPRAAPHVCASCQRELPRAAVRCPWCLEKSTELDERWK